MFRQENSNSPNYKASGPQTNGKKNDRKLYASIAGLTVVLIVLAALFIPQSAGSSLELSLNYKVGEHMVYDTINTVTNQVVNTSLSLPGITNNQSFNSTLTLDVIGSNADNYLVNETIVSIPDLFSHSLPPLSLNVSKSSYYNNFMAPGGPLIFYNASSIPTISAYLAEPTVKVGGVWKIPVNTGNASLGLTGEVTLSFAELQDLSVPAGTFKTIRVEVISNTLSLHSDGSSIIKIPSGMTLQLNGTSFIEQGTCRLIKADLTQATTTNSPTIGSTSILYTEKTLVEYSHP
jgi:hypothetical protein